MRNFFNQFIIIEEEEQQNLKLQQDLQQKNIEEIEKLNNDLEEYIQQEFKKMEENYVNEIKTEIKTEIKNSIKNYVEIVSQKESEQREYINNIKNTMLTEVNKHVQFLEEFTKKYNDIINELNKLKDQNKILQEKLSILEHQKNDAQYENTLEFEIEQIENEELAKSEIIEPFEQYSEIDVQSLNTTSLEHKLEELINNDNE